MSKYVVNVTYIDDGMVDGVAVTVFARNGRDAKALAARYMVRVHGCDPRVQAVAYEAVAA